MSVTQVPIRPIERGSLTRLWLALGVLVALAFTLAWCGTRPMQGETTPSGLHIRTIKEGQGNAIKPLDGVFVEYVGRLEDGTVFDASNGQPRPFLVGQVVPGFSEGLQKMKKGGVYSLRIPPQLGYGAEQKGPIPANSTLLFDVQVVEVVPNAALMAGGAAPQGAQPGL